MAYEVTIADRIQAYCTACDRPQYIYVQVEDGVRITACCRCSRILRRENLRQTPAAPIEKSGV
jgi:Zn ribbon nucleic-acid-binding protein